jgi:Fe-S cluster biogenesis protein NfuA
MALEPLVEFIVRDMSRQALQPDGGDAELVDVTDDGVAIVRFDAGRNEECATCVMTAEDFRLMLLERIQAMAPQIRELRFVSASSVG